MKTAIIGGGIGGLITALYLRQQGDEVVIYEKDFQLGGRLAFVEHQGYRIDKGPTIVLLPDMIYTILEEVGIKRSEIELLRIDPLYKLNYPDGMDFYKWSDTEKQINEISRQFPGQENGFLTYLDQMKWRFDQGKSAFLDRSFVRKNDFFNPSTLKTLWKLKAYQTVREQVKQFFSHPRLQEAFSFQTLYIGGSPFRSPAMYSLVPFSEHYHGIWYVKGGYASIVSLLESKLRERGVTIMLGHEVTSLETSQSSCRGVWIDGQLAEADRFVLNGDFPLARKLVPKEQSNKSYTPSSACLLLYLGLSRPFEEADVHQFIMSDDFDKHMKDVFVDKQLPKDPSMYVFYPSKIDSSLAPHGKAVMYVLIPVPSGSNINWTKIDKYVDNRLDILENRGFKGIKAAIDWMEIRTPADAEQEGLYEGGSFGIAPTLTQSGVFRPQLRPFSYNNIYAVGASVHPGGGIPIVMQGAKLLADYLKDEKNRLASS
ncbi:phytoene desaturase family protein [Bacillus suaedae]|uniref:Phytoene desaturase n=1 Tax=Halalkalibacter suaedae TaxID=2822140 RepID=A0A940WUY1_9BACI|nr:phytoene desaturase family protein [Bacillus suaedae]MBP3951107.1 phytoene desaturase [Bacillus suaedae]